MIFYFSATGNCKYVAERLAGETGGGAFSITNFDFSVPVADEVVGVVSPTYFWGLPNIVAEFLEKLKISGEPYLFFVSTYGTTPGASAKMADDIIKKGGRRFDAAYSIIMPDTWTPVFDLSDKKAVRKTLALGEAETEQVISAVKERRKGFFAKRAVPKAAAAIAYSFYGNATKTSSLSVNGDCVSCGLCAKKCPAHAIEMRGGKPFWVKDKCVMCLSCLHRCPKFAIQRGAKTKKHGQYRNPNTAI